MIVKPYDSSKIPHFRPPIVAEFAKGQSGVQWYVEGEGIQSGDGEAFAMSLYRQPAYTPIITRAHYEDMFYTLPATNFDFVQRSSNHGYLRTKKYLGLHTIRRIPYSDISFGEYIAGIYTAYEYLQSYGINLGGNKGTSEKVMGLFLTEPLIPRAPKKAAIGHRGGRNYLYNPDTYHDVAYWDINAAYPHAMTVAPFPTTFERDHYLNTELAGDGIAKAIITTPDTSLEGFYVGPILCSVDDSEGGKFVYTPNTTVTVWAPYQELRMARDYGTKVRVVDTFTGTAYVDNDFVEGFYDFVHTARQIRNPLGRLLLKGIVNAAWSTFCTRNDRQTIYNFTDPLGQKRKRMVASRQTNLKKIDVRGFPISTVIAGRVRCKLYREALAPDVKPSAPILAKTDSVFSLTRVKSRPLSHAPSGPIGEGIGEWSLGSMIKQLTAASTAQYFYYTEDQRTALTYEESLPKVVDSASRIGYHDLTVEDKINRIKIINHNLRSGSMEMRFQPKARKLARGNADWMDAWLRKVE